MRRLLLVEALLGLAFALTGNIATNLVARPNVWWWTWAVGAVVGLLAAGLLWVVDRVQQRTPEEAGTDDQAIEKLAGWLEKQWSDEARRRQVTAPAPLLVDWSSSGRPAADRQDVMRDPLGGDWQQFPLRGHTDLPPDERNPREAPADGINQDIVTAFRGLPRRRRHLVVLGEPGAGKSVFALLLTLGLLYTRKDAGEAEVPVLLAINEWDPADPVEVFVARRLAEDYADVLQRFGDPRAVADRLLKHNRVLPVLDGLDELPAETIGKALNCLDEYASKPRPLVVTCRSREYEQAATRTETILATAAVVELEPVTISAAIKYLPHSPLALPRWEPVFAHLRSIHAASEQGLVAAGTDPLAAALSTPLMVSLARAAYQQPSSRPGELLDLGSTAQVTAKLMDTFVAAAYTDSPDQGETGRAERRRVRARRWLECLAYHLHTTGTRDWHWWGVKPDLLAAHRRRTPPWTRWRTETAAPVAAGFLAGIAIDAFDLWSILPGGEHGLGSALAAALIIGVAEAGWLRPLWPHGYPPPHARTTVRTRYSVTRTGLLLGHGLGGAALVGLITTSWAAVVPAGLVCALLTAVVPAWRPAPPVARTPTTELGDNRRVIAAVAGQQALTSGAVFGLAAALTHGPAVAAGITAGIVYGTIAGLVTGGWAWTRFRLTHARLALHGWLPWRLSGFLADAHRRGILRQAGNVYQYRHAVLHDHLASALRLRHLRNLADMGDRDAAYRLAVMLKVQGHVDEAIGVLRTRIDAGDTHAAFQLARLLVEQGRIDELRSHADAGDKDAAFQLANLLAEQGNVEGLRSRADAGDEDAARQLSRLLVGQGHVDEVIGVLRARIDAGDTHAAFQLADLLAEQGRIDDAIGVLRARIGDEPVTDWRSAEGYAAGMFARLLAEQGYVDELRSRADAGDTHAADQLADLLAGQGHVEELGIRADAGDAHAASRLADLLAEQGHVDELRSRADAGDRTAASRLSKLLAEQGHVDKLIAFLRTHPDAGYTPATSRLANLLAEQGDVEGLRTCAETGDTHAAIRLANLLAEQGDIEGLRARADAGDTHAANRLASLLAEQGNVEGLRARADAGDTHAANQLTYLLVGQGDIDEAIAFLRARADTGDTNATRRLADLLVGQGHVDEAIGVLQAHSHTKASDDWGIIAQLIVLQANQKQTKSHTNVQETTVSETTSRPGPTTP